MRQLALAAALALLALPAIAEEPSFTLLIRNHRFEPASLEVPAGQKIQLIIKNLDASAEEFDSKSLKREKIIAGGREAVVMIGPLTAGRYPFVGEYHEDTAKGEIVAK